MWHIFFIDLWIMEAAVTNRRPKSLIFSLPRPKSLIFFRHQGFRETKVQYTNFFALSESQFQVHKLFPLSETQFQVHKLLFGSSKSSFRYTNFLLCYLCYAMLCFAMLCYVMLCYVMLCYVMLCCVMLCYDLCWCVSPCSVELYVVVMSFLYPANLPYLI